MYRRYIVCTGWHPGVPGSQGVAVSALVIDTVVLTVVEVAALLSAVTVIAKRSKNKIPHASNAFMLLSYIVKFILLLHRRRVVAFALSAVCMMVM